MNNRISHHLDHKNLEKCHDQTNVLPFMEDLRDMDSKNNSPSHNWVVVSNIWRRFPFGLIFFKGVETTNQIIWVSFGLSPFSVVANFQVFNFGIPETYAM